MDEKEVAKLNLSSKTVLIVDDEEPYRKFLAKIIEKFLKSKVLQAKNPKEAFEILAHTIPDLILLDLQMPLMDGQTALKYIRSNEKTAGIPVLICSALGFESVITSLAKQGISGFIIKPCDANTVLSKIYQILIK